MLQVPQSPDVSMVFARKIYRLILIISVFWLLLIILPPLLSMAGGFFEVLSDYMYIAFSPICHQEEARSFTLSGLPLGVCSRCTMIYAGMAAGVIAYPFSRRLSNVNPPSLLFLLIPACLLFADVLFDSTGVFRNTFLTRSVTGFIIGAALSFFLIPGFIRFFFELVTFFNGKQRARL